MPPVDEATFIEKADLLIAKLALLAEAINDARLAMLAEQSVNRTVLREGIAQLVFKADTAIENTLTANKERNDIEIARIKRVPLRHGGRADGVL